MKKTLLGTVASVCLAFFILGQNSRSGMVAGLTEVIGLLDGEQRASLEHAFDDRARTDWAYTPRSRKGVPLKNLGPEQRKAVERLLEASLSQGGFRTAQQIMQLDGVLHEMEGRNPIRDPEAYYLALFGAPAGDGLWAWRFEGHHLSLNFTLSGNELLSVTPLFFGANPATIRSGSESGKRTLAAEEDIARRFLLSLSPSDRSRAVISEQAPWDIVTGNSRRAEIGDPKGLPYHAMSAQQRKTLLELLDVYLGRLEPTAVTLKRQELEAQGFDKLHFAWAGGDQPGTPHYYRIHGPTFLIEYDNTQNGANHIHSVMRDLKSDFGGDPLRSHYQQLHAHKIPH
jgi:hypothetical protein